MKKENIVAYKPLIEKTVENQLKKAGHIAKDWKEDLVQDSILKALINKDKYKGNKAKIATWLINITKNTCIDFMRKKVNSEVKTDNYDLVEAIAKTSKKPSFNINRYFKVLNEREQMVVKMRHYKDIKNMVIAERLSITPSNVALIYKRAKVKIERALKNDGIDGMHKVWRLAD